MTDATNPYDALSDHLHGQGAPASDTGENAMPELKPCPFCGGKALPQRHAVFNETGAVRCEKCSAIIISHTKGDVIAAWNTRADLTQPQAVAVEVKPLVWEKAFVGHEASGVVSYRISRSPRGWRLITIGYNIQYFPTLEDTKFAADAYNRARILSQITARSVDEVLEQAAEAAENAPCTIFHMPHEAWMFELQRDDCAAAIRALKSPPDQAGADPQGNQPQTQQVLAEKAVPDAKEISPQGDWISPEISGA